MTVSRSTSVTMSVTLPYVTRLCCDKKCLWYRVISSVTWKKLQTILTTYSVSSYTKLTESASERGSVAGLSSCLKQAGSKAKTVLTVRVLFYVPFLIFPNFTMLLQLLIFYKIYDSLAGWRVYDRGIGVRFPTGLKDISPPTQNVQTGWGSNPSYVQFVPPAIFPGVRRSGRRSAPLLPCMP